MNMSVFGFELKSTFKCKKMWLCLSSLKS